MACRVRTNCAEVRSLTTLRGSNNKSKLSCTNTAAKTSIEFIRQAKTTKTWPIVSPVFRIVVHEVHDFCIRPVPDLHCSLNKMVRYSGIEIIRMKVRANVDRSLVQNLSLGKLLDALIKLIVSYFRGCYNLVNQFAQFIGAVVFVLRFDCEL